MSDLMLDVDQAGELKAAFRRGNWTNAEIKKLCEGDILTQVRNVVRGFADVVPKQHVIDCNAEPFCPDGWKIEEHIPGGKFEWDPNKVDLFLSQKQKKGVIGGNELRQELKGKPVLNAIVLDYLLVHPELIPEEWKGKAVFFWGTIYRDSGGDLDVRYLGWGDSQWYWSSYWLDFDWHDISPAALARK